ALGWEQVPHLSVVCRRLHGDDVRRLRTRLWRKLRRRSLRQGDLRVLTIDMTDLPVPLRRKDPDATWGATSKGKFFGYKLHLVISRTGFPLAFRVTPGRRPSRRGISWRPFSSFLGRLHGAGCFWSGEIGRAHV